jgi:glycosyltransferase involved in cell wall biosynthesis
MTPATFVINSSNPELDYLAAALCREGSLTCYLRRYANKRRWFERLLEGMPISRGAYGSTFGRRHLPQGLDPARVKTAGVALEFAAAILPRITSRSALRSVKRGLTPRIDRELALAASRIGNSDRAQVVVGNYGLSYRAFEHAKKIGKALILNYPITHHRYTRSLLSEEADLQPEFASTIAGPFHTPARIANEEQEFALADRILVGSTFARESFIWAGVSGNKVSVVNYGADTTVFVPPAHRQCNKEIAVIYAGQIGQRKGISYLLRAFKELHSADIKLTVAGTMLLQPSVASQYRDLFKYVGHLNRPALAEEFQKADVFVFPTLIEGMPLTVIEAMAAGLPVITTSHGPGDIVRDGVEGFIVPIRDHQAIAEKLIYLKNNPDHRLEMGRNARLRALTFTWDRYSDNALQVLSDIWLEKSSVGVRDPAPAATFV